MNRAKWYDHEKNKFCLYAIAFGITAVICDQFVGHLSSVASATSMMVCIFVAGKCHWKAVEALIVEP